MPVLWVGGDRQTKNQLPAVRWSHLSNRNPIQPRYHLDKSGYIPPFRVSTLSAVILNVWSGGTERHKERQTDKQSNIQKDRKTERQKDRKTERQKRRATLREKKTVRISPDRNSEITLELQITRMNRLLIGTHLINI